jgi:hypothetical protein
MLLPYCNICLKVYIFMGLETSYMMEFAVIHVTLYYSYAEHTFLS